MYFEELLSPGVFWLPLVILCGQVHFSFDVILQYCVEHVVHHKGGVVKEGPGGALWTLVRAHRSRGSCHMEMLSVLKA